MKHLLNFKLTPLKLILISALWMMLWDNYSFFSKVIAIYPPADGQIWFLISLAILAFVALCLLMLVFSLILPTRVVVGFCLISAAASGYFADHFGVIIDSLMLETIFETDLKETTDLLSLAYLVRLFGLGVIPAIVIFCIPMQKLSFFKATLQRIVVIGLCTLIAAAIILASSDRFASFFREHKPIRYFSIPVYPVYSLIRYTADQFSSSVNTQYVSRGYKSSINEQDESHELTIVVVGETARADHFSLNGYAKPTNPLLSQEQGVISFTNVSSCGTSTAVSVPCMFSIDGKDKFDLKSAPRTANVLDVISQAGVDVLWRDNNSDSKGVASRVAFEDFRTSATNTICDHGECRDVGMLVGLQEYIDQHHNDILIVLHQMGSHGPAYFRRYPPEFEVFTPACHSIELGDCSQAEIINAYDNSIRYTDYFLSQVIELLKQNSPRFEVGLIYASDHGESLGENGMYLHGLPYMIAPKTQTHIPLIVWGDKHSDIELNQTRLLKDKIFSHDALATVLTQIFETQTNAKLPQESFIQLKAEEDEH